MLRLCTKEEFENHIDFAYALATDLSASGYPTYCDGIKTKEMFVDRARKAFERETEDMLIFERGGAVRGFIHYYYIPEDRYLQTCMFNVDTDTEQALSEFLAYVGARFAGYDLYMGFPAENRAAAAFLADRGFACIENDYNNTAYLDGRAVPDDHGLVRVGKENFAAFRSLHEQIDGDMFWNSDRICADLDKWIILVKEQNGAPQGAVYYTDAADGWFEIFGVDIDRNQYDPVLFGQLLNAALVEARRRGGRFMTFFCEKEYEETAKACGFICVGEYLCFKARLG